MQCHWATQPRKIFRGLCSWVAWGKNFWCRSNSWTTYICQVCFCVPINVVNTDASENTNICKLRKSVGLVFRTEPLLPKHSLECKKTGAASELLPWGLSGPTLIAPEINTSLVPRCKRRLCCQETVCTPADVYSRPNTGHSTSDLEIWPQKKILFEEKILVEQGDQMLRVINRPKCGPTRSLSNLTQNSFCEKK
jgi:hypothetical protein